jgi:hypothetical protein
VLKLKPMIKTITNTSELKVFLGRKFSKMQKERNGVLIQNIFSSSFSIALINVAHTSDDLFKSMDSVNFPESVDSVHFRYSPLLDSYTDFTSCHRRTFVLRSLHCCCIILNSLLELLNYRCCVKVLS